MSKITFSFFILLLLTSCATSKFDFATAYKFQTVKRYPSSAEGNTKVLPAQNQVLANYLNEFESMDLKYHLPKKTSIIHETVSLRNLNPSSEELIQSKLNAYKEGDNMSKKDIKRNNKRHKIITRLSDIKFDTIVTESGLVVPLLEKKETPEEAKKEIGLKIAQFVAVSAGTVILLGLGLFILFI
jgi:hypothetical protein